MKVSPKYVVDASVVVKWFSRFEEDADSSEKLLNSHIEGAATLISSSLVLYEVCNGSSMRNHIQAASNLLEKVATNGIDFIQKKCYFIDRAIKKLASSSHQNNPRHVKLLRQFPRSDVLAPNSGRSVAMLCGSIQILAKMMY
jgi:hypothetical protein